MISHIKTTLIHDVSISALASMSIASPWWLPFLVEVSFWAGLLLPILGVVLLGLQIYSKLKTGKNES